MKKNYRNLLSEEIEQLQLQRCHASDWTAIQVAKDFNVNLITNVNFEGHICIGNQVTLQNIAVLRASGDTTFANGLKIDVLSEVGDLPVAIYDKLTSMEAAFEVMETNTNPDLVAKLQAKARAYAEAIRCDACIIEDRAIVKNCLELEDVHIGKEVEVIGASRLKDVTLCDTNEGKPIHIGAQVVLEHVIVGTESMIVDGAQMDHCLVGQGCHIGRMYSATSSLFFANCHFENGEACAYFAGPYSVSHHKSTLMIACMTSFFNAGSGSNQSNHSYKMGPNKYGQLARGSKLGSNSYVYWPMQIGPFSTVIMHHTGHQDLRELPFSLITEGQDGKTHIVPGQALRSVGTRRDINKWPKRDQRTDTPACRLDRINFSMLNPYTIGYILKGLEVLKELKTEGKTEYKGCIISHRHIEGGIMLYQQAITIYRGQQAQRHLLQTTEGGTGEWQDYGGMLLPKAETYEALARGENFEDLEQYLTQWESNWVDAHFDKEDYKRLIANGKSAENAWNTTLDIDGSCDLAACQLNW